MTNDLSKNKENNQQHSNEEPLMKPDPETLDKTDPQEAMKGPLSSLAQKGGKVMESKLNKEEATKKHNDEM